MDINAHRSHSTKALTSPSATAQSNTCSAPAVSVKEKEAADSDVNSIQETPLENTSLLRSGRVSRVSPPFIASHDLPRGAIFAFQALIAYLLMLAVMCVPFTKLPARSHLIS